MEREAALAWLCEIVVGGDVAQGPAVAAWCAASLPRLAALPHLEALDVYESAAGNAQDPYNQRETPPLALLLAAFSDEAALRDAFAAPALAEVLAAPPKGATITASGLRRVFYPPDDAGSMPAPVSYVVRYLRPAADEEAFRRAYVATLVPIQAELAGIRSVLCYFPVAGLAAPGTPSMDYVIGNEVAFDSVDAFNAAMRSPARDRLRTQSGTLPAVTGGGSHVLMRRRRLVGMRPA